MPTRCRKGGPLIQSPFRLKYQHPEYCGYPGFDVYCDEKNETVLVLPISVNVTVKKIDYASQIVYLYYPGKCLPQKLPYLNLSVSPFHFMDAYIYDYNLFNCSGPRVDLYDFILIRCFDDSNHYFYAIPYALNIDPYDVTSCPSVHKISSVPYGILDKSDLHLAWSEPACGLCECRGQRCNLKNYTRGDQIQCIDKEKTNPDISFIPKSSWMLSFLSMTHSSEANFVVYFGATLGSVLVVTIFAALFLLYRSIRVGKENELKIEKFLENYRALKPTRFSYSDVRRITNQFREKLGEGGYGIVYKGKLSNEINVAVKVLNNSKGNGEEFVNEVGTIGRIHHINVVRLVGYCAEGFRRVLVYEFLPNDSLEKFIFRAGLKRNSLGWPKLQDIALGIAKGIEYLDQGCDQQILHFDIKPHNILLDHNFIPKICDFGLAKLCAKEQSVVTMTAARGTMGYIAPEVLSRTFGRVSYKSDVYSFGMLLLEMVGGRKNIDPEVNTSQVNFPQWIYNHLSIGEDLWINIEQEDDRSIVRKLTIVGLWCIQWHPTDSPSMKVAVQMLEGDGDNLDMPPNPFPATNSTSSAAGIRGRQYQAELPLILEIE
ncbi:Rust resistance kinase Lr10 [Sesamum alatum]|uniref:Rust resistance kinase Lr10 n=1 Tax=Sesamum alatum TaxID=300844 RepID=A0AAE2CHW1_9LAMI|nr:Rust resistance kinase Lr10 [Sesamum alatum]